MSKADWIDELDRILGIVVDDDHHGLRGKDPSDVTDLDELRLMVDLQGGNRVQAERRIQEILGSMDGSTVLGQGAFGKVRLLRSDEADGPPPIAFKELTDTEGRDLDDIVDEMDEEARIYSRIGPHKNIARCYGVVQVDGNWGLAMQAIEGGELGDSFKGLRAQLDAGLITQAEYTGTIAYLSRGILEGLRAMKEAGKVHHDIKPGNVMIDQETLEPVIIDMGLARDTGSWDIGGTPGYTDASAGEGADVLAVGSTVYEAMEGEEFAERIIREHGMDPETAPAMLIVGRTATTRPHDEVHTKQGPGEVATGGRTLAYPDFVAKLLRGEAGGIDLQAALDHPFLADSGLPDERAREVLGQVIGKRKGRQERTGDLVAKIRALKPSRLVRQAKALEKRLARRVEETRRVCDGDIASDAVEGTAADLEAALVPDSQQLAELTAKTRDLAGHVRSARGEGLESGIFGVLEALEGHVAKARAHLGTCRRMIRALADGSFDGSFGAHAAALRPRLVAAIAAARAQVAGTDDLVLDGERLLEVARGFLIDGQPDPDLDEDVVDEAVFARMRMEASLAVMGATLEEAQATRTAVREHQAVHENTGLEDPLAELDDLLRELGVARQRATSSLMDARVPLAKVGAGTREKRAEYGHILLLEALPGLRVGWLDSLRRVPVLAGAPPEGMDDAALNGLDAARGLLQGQLSAEEAEDAIELAREGLRVAQERALPLNAIRELVVAEARKVEPHAHAQGDYDAAAEIDPRLTDLSKAGSTLTGIVDAWESAWFEVIDTCREGVDSPAALAVAVAQQAREFLPRGEQWEEGRAEWSALVADVLARSNAMLKEAKRTRRQLDRGQAGARNGLMAYGRTHIDMAEDLEPVEEQLRDLEFVVGRLAGLAVERTPEGRRAKQLAKPLGRAATKARAAIERVGRNGEAMAALCAV